MSARRSMSHGRSSVNRNHYHDDDNQNDNGMADMGSRKGHSQERKRSPSMGRNSNKGGAQTNGGDNGYPDEQVK